MYYIRKRKKSAKKKVLIALICVILAIIFIITFINRKLDVIARDVVSEQIKNEITSTVANIISGYDLSREYIKTTYENGSVKSITTNTGELNKLKATAMSDISAAIGEKSEYRIDVSYANIFDDEVIFGNMYFKMSASVLPVYSVSADIRTVFENAGINQTHFSLILSINVDVNAVLLISTVNIVSEYEVCIADTVIVGDVPGVYLYGE